MAMDDRDYSVAMGKDLTVFTVANGRYEPFVLPYVASVLWSNPEAVVEIGLSEPRRFAQENADALEIIEEHVGRRFLFSRIEMQPHIHAMRFLVQPRRWAEYVYIGDIDILVLEDIAAGHIAHMERTGLPYSNIRRSGRDQLTGLHFTRWDAMYPIRSDGITERRDEILLFELLRARGLDMPSPEDRYRPIHGYHLSLSRSPTGEIGGRPGWDGINEPAYLSKYIDLRRSAFWRQLAPFFDRRYRQLLTILDAKLSGLFPEELRGLDVAPGTLPRDWW